MEFRKKQTIIYKYSQHSARVVGERTKTRSAGRPTDKSTDGPTRLSEARYRAPLESPAYGIVLCNLLGDFLNVSEPVVTTLGYHSKNELLELSLAKDVFRNPRKCGQLLRKYIQAGQVEPSEVEWKRKDGSSLPVRLRMVEARDASGALKGCEIIVEDLEELKALEKQGLAAGIDTLTGLGNRRRFLDVLEAEIGWSERSRRPFAVVLFHLKGLKGAGQGGSQTVGKPWARRMADVLRLYCRSMDTAVRYDDDDFGLVLPETGPGAAALTAWRIRDCLTYGDGQPLSVEVDGGVYPDDSEMVENLMETFRDLRQGRPRRAAV